MKTDAAMEKAFRVIKDIQKKGVIDDYAIGGGVAAVFYMEPALTYDLDVFIIVRDSGKNLIFLAPIFKALRQHGYKTEKEHLLIEGIPVQFLPVYNELIRESVEQAVEINYGKTTVRILRPEYLTAIMAQTSRPKDRERIAIMLEQVKMNMPLFRKIVRRHSLTTKLKKLGIHLHESEK